MATTQTNLSRTYALQRLKPRNDEELWWCVRGLWGKKIPRHSCDNPDHKAPFTAFADAYFARHPVTVWKASRGYGGKSLTLAMLSLTEAVTLGAGVSILGGSGAQSANVHQHTSQAWGWRNAPRSLLEKDNVMFTSLNNNGWMRALMASMGSVRGPHPERLRLDEIDEMTMEILEAAQGQPMRRRDEHGNVSIETQTVMSSTHQYPDKTMHAILMRAKENDWPVYEWCWRCTANPVDGWLQQDEIARKRKEVSSRMWEVEYDLQEPSFEGRAIDTDLVDWAFKKSLGEFEGEPDCVIRIESPADEVMYGSRFPYVTAVDWAKEKDWTVVGTFRIDEDPWVLVAFKRYQRHAWPVMVNKAEAQWFAYGGVFIHDATGLGNVVSDLLTGPRKHITDQVMSGGDRTVMFNEYIAAIENKHVTYPHIEWMYNEHKYVTDEDLFTSKGHPPDSFVMGSLAWRMRPRQRGKMPRPEGIRRLDESLLNG